METASSIIGIFVTPLLVSLVLSSHAGSGSALRTIGEIVLQLFVPFACGQLLQPLIGGWIERNESIVGAVDQGSILLIVYIQPSAKPSTPACGIKCRLQRWRDYSSLTASSFSPLR